MSAVSATPVLARRALKIRNSSSASATPKRRVGGTLPLAADLAAERQTRDLFIESTVPKMPVEYRFAPTMVSDDV